MTAKRLAVTGALFFLFAEVWIETWPPSLGQEPGAPARPRFYAIRVVSEERVLDARESLGAPDGRYAEILPGGRLVLFMAKKLRFFVASSGEERGVAADSGSIIANGATNAVLEGCFLMVGGQRSEDFSWRAFGFTATGFYIWTEDDTGVDMIRITNEAQVPLFVDSVIGYTRQKAEPSRRIRALGSAAQ